MIRFGQAIDRAHRFALWHRNKLTEGDPARFSEDWKVFSATLKKRGEQWSEEEYAIMLSYSMSALRYDSPPHGVRPSEWREGGLWAPQWGTIATPSEDEKAAA